MSHIELVYNEKGNTLFVGQTIGVGTHLFDDNGCECRIDQLTNTGALLSYPDGSVFELSIEEVACMRKDDSILEFHLRCI